MKSFYLTFFCTLIILSSQSQNIRRIAVYDNNSSSSSGIIGFSDTTIFEYSWYYSAWLDFPNTGLVRKNGIPQIDEICSFDSGSGNPSGIYVVSDTTVFVYNYYVAEWLPLSNNGLVRINDTVQISDISAYLETSTSTERIFVISDTAVFRYDWYMQTWYPLSNSGLSAKSEMENATFENLLKNYPNPFSGSTTISYSLPEEYIGNVRLALFSNDGRFIKELINEVQNGGEHHLSLSGNDFVPGTYFYELLGDNFSHVKRMIVIE
ncbi:MAG: T9SS type A sorting domain-containing protein [Bacteroidota bacterium]